MFALYQSKTIREHLFKHGGIFDIGKQFDELSPYFDG